MNIGYARVSSVGQKLDNQIERLTNKSCKKIFREKYSGASTVNRKQLKLALEYVREGDALIVTKLDRLARSATDLGIIAKQLQDKNVDLVVLDQSIDTTSPTGSLMFNMIAAFSQFERDLINERCAEGIRKAKENGVKFGRKAKLSSTQIESLKKEFQNAEFGRAELCSKYKISRASLYRLVS